MEQIAQQINDALRQVYSKEIFFIAGKHMQRDAQSGLFRFLPGKSKQSLLNDIGTFTEVFVTYCRGVGFNLRVKETNTGGVSLDVTSVISAERGNNLVDRSG